MSALSERIEQALARGEGYTPIRASDGVPPWLTRFRWSARDPMQAMHAPTEVVPVTVHEAARPLATAQAIVRQNVRNPGRSRRLTIGVAE